MAAAARDAARQPRDAAPARRERGRASARRRAHARPRRRRRAQRIAPLAVVAVLLGAWELVVRAGMVDELLLPAPTQVAAVAVGGPLAARARPARHDLRGRRRARGRAGARRRRSPSRCTSCRTVEIALRPLVVGSQAVPIPVIAPIIVLIFGFGLAPKILIIALICFFPVTVNVADGLRDSDPDARKLLRSLDATRVAAAAAARRAVGAARRVHGHEGRRRDRGDRRGAGGVVGLGRRARAPADHRQRPARDARARSPRPRC